MAQNVDGLVELFVLVGLVDNYMALMLILKHVKIILPIVNMMANLAYIFNHIVHFTLHMEQQMQKKQKFVMPYCHYCHNRFRDVLILLG